MTENEVTSQHPFLDAAPLMALSRFCGVVGITYATAWKWRKLGWLKTVNIAGRVYVSDWAEFKRRADAGEFSGPHPVPPRRKGFLPGNKIEAESAA